MLRESPEKTGRGVKAQPPASAVRARPCITRPPAPSTRTPSGRPQPGNEPPSAHALVSAR
jgi:hypothetical protein